MTVIAIPSYRRPEGCAERTLSLLGRLGGHWRTVEVWLSDPAERGAYRAHTPAWADIRIGAPTLRGNRAAIMQAHPGEDVLFCDDDLDDLVVLTEDGMSTRSAGPSDFVDLLANGFGECEERGLRLWGVSPVANHFFMKWRSTAGRSFCIGSFYGLRVPEDPTPYVTEHCEKEDYERSLRAYEHDGGVVRVAWAAPKTTYYRGGGGMVDDRTVGAQEDAVRYIEQRWPGWTRRNTKRTTGFPEIVINPRRIA